MKAWLVRIWRTIRYVLLRATAARGKRHPLVLVVGIVAIVAWQYGFTAPDVKFDTTYRNTAASGMHNDAYFVYFYWYEGLFPVSSTLQHAPCGYRCAPTHDSMAPVGGYQGLSKEAADNVLKTQGDTLVMDTSWTWYAGDRGKIFLFMLDTWLKGAPYRPSTKPFHRLMFMTALSSLFFAFWWTRRPLLGALMVLFLGSNPFQLYEVNVNDNVFGWTITTAILMLAIHLPLLTPRKFDPWTIFLWPIGAGLLMATIRTARSEPMPMAASALFAYLFVRFRGDFTKKQIWMRRGALVAAFLGFVVLGGQAWNRFFLMKHNQAIAALTKVHGHPYPGNVRLYHHFWHPVWCGLGDFDKKKGYVWDDTQALAYARPILEQKFHQYVPNPYPDRNLPKSLDEYWDAEGFYKKLPYDIPNYNEIIRDKVLSDIKNDPKWYAEILGKRVDRLVNEATPVRVTTRSGHLDIPWLSGKLFAPLLVLCLLARARLASRLLMITVPSVTTALIVFCAKGPQWYGIFHLVTAALVVAVLLEALRIAARAGVDKIMAGRRAA